MATRKEAQFVIAVMNLTMCKMGMSMMMMMMMKKKKKTTTTTRLTQRAWWPIVNR